MIDSAVLTHLVTGIDIGIEPATIVIGSTVPDPNGLVIAIVDASGTPGTAGAIAADLTARGYVVASVQPSVRTFEASMVMPVDTPSDRSRELLAVLGVGGFDAWTATLIDGSLAATVTDVIVIGSGRAARIDTPGIHRRRRHRPLTGAGSMPDGTPVG